MKASLQAAFDLAETLLDLELREPVREYREPEELAQALDLELGRKGETMAALLEDLEKVLTESPRIASPRFLNLLFGGRDAAATIAEIVAVLANTPMHTFKAAGAQVLVEQAVLEHMAKKVGFEDGEGLFTAGGSLSNLTALVLARNEASPEAREEGLSTGVRFVVYASGEAHFSISRGMGIIGLGRRQVRTVPVDDAGRMRVDALREMIVADLESGMRPMMINATAGTTILGAFDPLREIASVAREHGLWLHVDGAYGGSVLLSDQHRHLLDGSEEVDSFSWDAHKAMSVPLSCSVLLIQRRGLLHKHFSETAGYLFQSHEAYNPGQQSMQCARRNDALKLWAAWRFHGDEGYAQRIDRLFALARYATGLVAADPDLQLCHQPESLNICFEVLGISSVEICERLEREARIVISHVPLYGRRMIRLVCVNPDLSEADIDAFFREVKTVSRTIAKVPTSPVS